ncbi:MAG: RsmE family RNA methyltransferase [Candidatus Kaelpia aquatica]|nr:RsmE family RNA methyltransferase [Candidatus Kaelpia aquatica]
MDKHYFYNPELEEKDKTVLLKDEEFYHLDRVLRLKESDIVYVLNGRGVILEGEIRIKTKDHAKIEVLNSIFVEKSKEVVLLQSLIKKEAMESVVEKAQELGVSILQPVIAVRSVVKLKEEEKIKKRLERWRKIAIETIKQSGNPYLLEVLPPLVFASIVDKYKNREGKFIFKIEGNKINITSENMKDNAVLLIGPEGDFTEEEYKLAEDHGFKPLSLGSARLRSETAATVAVALFNYSI